MRQNFPKAISMSGMIISAVSLTNRFPACRFVAARRVPDLLKIVENCRFLYAVQ
jgi:hypothetical protein